MKKIISKIFASCFLVGMAFLVAGCGAGSGEGLDEQGRPEVAADAPQDEVPAGETPNTETPDDANGDQPDDGGADDGSAQNPATLSRIQSEILSARCAICHTGAGAPRGLRLDSVDTSFSLLVGVASDEVPSLLRVNPGDPDNSYLVRKIEGAPDIVGQQMPLGGPPLSAEQIALVREWIRDGALDDTAASSQSLQVSAVGIRNALEIEKTLSLDIYFNQVVDPQSLVDEAIQLSLVSDDERRLLSPRDYQWKSQAQRLTLSYFGEVREGDALELVLNPEHSATIQTAEGLVLSADISNGNIADADVQNKGGFHYVYKF